MADQSSASSQVVRQTSTDREQILRKLCSSGFSVVFETVVSVYRCELTAPAESEHSAESANGSSLKVATDHQQWQIVDYGILALTVKDGAVELNICDIESGDPVRKFSLQSDSCYSDLDAHFHAFVDCAQNREGDRVHCFGISTPDEAVAKKILVTVRKVIPLSSQQYLSELGVPPLKRDRLDNEGESNAAGDNEWVIIERKDVPETEDEEMIEQKDISEMEGEEEMLEAGEDGDETDSALVRLRAGMKRGRHTQEKTRSLVISEPQEFRHIAHVGQDTSVSNMTKAMSVDISQSPDISVYSGSLELGTGSMEPGTEETSSFVEVPKEDLPALPPAPVPPPPPPVVKPPEPVILGKKRTNTDTLKPAQTQNFGVSLDEILKRRGTLRRVGEHRIVPEPPPKPDRTKLFSDINTFDRNTLKHTEHKNHDSIDVDDPNCLQSILKVSLMRMREKLSVNFCQVGNVNSEGDEEGFGDECDGPLFIED